MAVEAGQSSKGTVASELRENAVGLPGILMQGIATIGPSFAILASFVFIVGYAGIMTPWAFLFGGILLGLQALFPSAGGWYTWIARAFHPRAGFFAGVLFSIWLPPVATLTMSYLAKTVLEPGIKSEWGVDIPWWIWVIVGVALVIFFAYQGIAGLSWRASEHVNVDLPEGTGERWPTRWDEDDRAGGHQRLRANR